MPQLPSRLGPFVIMLAASLWAADALFRTELTFRIPAAFIIFFEHLIGFLILSPIFIARRHELKQLTRSNWVNVILLTLVSRHSVHYYLLKPFPKVLR